MAFDHDKAMTWLRLYDKHLWGINAQYKDATRLAVGLDLSVSRLRKMLWQLHFTEIVDDAGEVKRTRRTDWSGIIDWWKSPDWSSGPKKATTSIALTMSQWDKAKQFVAEHKAMLTAPDSTMAFCVRYMRSHWMSANPHIITELFTSRKMPLPKEKP